MIRFKAFTSLSLLFLFVLFSCSTPQAVVEEQFEPNTSVQDYITTLVRLDMDTTALGSQWIQWADPLSNLPDLSLVPFSEQRFFDPAVPEAAYLLFEGVRGQQISINLEPDSDMSYFADVFGMGPRFDPRNPDSEVQIEQVASALFFHEDQALRQGPSQIIIEPRNTRFFLVRILPRLLEGGRMGITISNQAIATVWPVENTGPPQIWSFFGDPRDGGRRVHHGVDIFAPRGTPILAPVAGRITRVGERNLGGLSVSMMDDLRGISYYFAHLDSYGDVTAGQVVEAGHIIGYVGNTGNAITTPPHLHLGIYDRTWGSPVDPWYYLVQVNHTQFLNASALFEEWVNQNNNLELGVTIPYFYVFQDPAPRFFSQTSHHNPTVVSPARRDGRGEVIRPQDRHISRLSFDGVYQPQPGFLVSGGDFPPSIRFVALRRDALGFRFPDGSLRWLPRSNQNQQQLEQMILTAPQGAG
jgi:murein DD-endopeptidase MepM/ murein hydrolase activator NlpD